MIQGFKRLVVCVAVLLMVAGSAQAVLIEWVDVGNPGNAADTTTYGAVSYAYRISKYEVTNDQYTEFLNAVDATGANPNGVYSNSMGSDARGGISFASGDPVGSKYSTKPNMGNKPVNYVSFFDAMRFVNWLDNGQGSGDTEIGVYDLSADIGGLLQTRAGGASYFIPSENEWYKGAYYSTDDGDGNPGYWIYPTQSDVVPTVATADAVGDINNAIGAPIANYDRGADWNGQDGNVTTVGSGGAGSESFYGAADMGGNVWEWNEAVFGSNRELRGGSWAVITGNLESSFPANSSPSFEGGGVGFRVASPIPELGRQGCYTSYTQRARS